MNTKRQIVNIINFIRGCEPRMPMDLMKPVVEQIALMKKHNLRGTFLIQYDALILPEYVELLKNLPPEQYELGVWFEIMQPLVEKAGIPWTGRFPWDWHVHCGFPQGYTKQQREQLIDILFNEFREVFGYFPKVFGSWIFDSHTLRYISDKYGVDAVCNCKEQYGTDGYTLWGGYYGQAYYPSRTNMFMPAQTLDEQLPVPLFRMLGSDPVYQYDFGMDIETGADVSQKVITLEPVYLGTGGGGEPAWVDWFLNENFNGDCLSFGYAQAGQENSFGWEGMKDGLSYQFSEFARLQKDGKLIVEPLGDTGRWFKQNYDFTPSSAITAHSAWDDPDKKSVWYSSRFYRTNIYLDHGSLRIRDLHVFAEKHPDPYENIVCTSNDATYETLPLSDGNRHTAKGIIGGIYPIRADGSSFRFTEMIFNDCGSGALELDFRHMKITLFENRMVLTSTDDFYLEYRCSPNAGHVPEIIGSDAKHIDLRYEGTDYSVNLSCGQFSNNTIHSENGRIEACFL